MLQALLDATPARVVVADREHRFLFVNREILAFLHAPAEKVIGRYLRDVLGPAYQAAYQPLHAQIFDRGQSVQREGWVDYPFHGRLYVQENFLPHAPDGGPVVAVFVFIRDLTELKTREAELSAQLQQLQEAEALKSAIFDHALAAMVSSDAEGRVVAFNPAAERMFGHAREAVLGRAVSQVCFPERLRGLQRAGLQALRLGQPLPQLGQRIELQALHADGHEFPVEIVFWRTQVGSDDFYTATMVDLTERQAAAAEIARQRDALRQGEKLSAMGSLLAGVAHELNNPLAIVMGRSSLLRDKAAGSEWADDAQRIHEAAERCGRIVRTFLDMARQRPAVRQAVALNELVRGAADLLKYSLLNQGIALELGLAADLPMLWADADRLGQVVLNLMVNAQQALAPAAARAGQDSSAPNLGASPAPSHRRLRIETGTAPGPAGSAPGPAGEQLWLRVRDNGAGVAPALRARIFDPYFTTKPGAAGTGLGLSVSRAVAREHGGDLRLEDTDHGASFLLTLPLLPKDAVVATGPTAPGHTAPLAATCKPALALAPAPASSSSSAPVTAPVTAQTVAPRVLVVDDEPEIAEMIELMLTGAGHVVDCAASGAEALERLRQQAFDAIVCDLRMPGMDGPALWRRLQQGHAELAQRMLFVTGDSLSPGAQQFLIESGCSSLEKPFAKPELLAAVRACLARPTGRSAA